jgi:hypothetical protein
VSFAGVQLIPDLLARQACEDREERCYGVEDGACYDDKPGPVEDEWVDSPVGCEHVQVLECNGHLHAEDHRSVEGFFYVYVLLRLTKVGWVVEVYLHKVR